jgi:hypothetical protein
MTGHLNARLSFVFAAPWQPLRSIIYVQKLNYLAAVVTLKRLVPKFALAIGLLHLKCNTTCGTSRSSKLSEGAPQHDAKAGQIVVFGELSPIAGAALLLLQRRVKKAQQRVGNRTLDQARRSRTNGSLSAGRFIWCCPRTLQRNFDRSGRFFIVGYDADIISRSER